MNAVPAIRSAAAAAAPTLGATDWGVGGEAPAFYDISQISDADLVHVVPIAIVVIGLLLIIVMRSLVAPVYLILSVALSYFAALGLSVIVFMKIGGASGLTFILPFLMFIFLLALGEDYNILVMSRIREEAQVLPIREAVARALNATGTTVTSAGLVLAGTFAVFAVVGGRGSGGSQIRDVGIGLALGVLMDTFIVRTVLVPCTAVLLGRWNWWPSSLSRTAPRDLDETTEPEAAGGRRPGFPGPGTRALVGLGVDGRGQLAQRGGGVAQRGLVMLRQRGQRGPDDLLVDPVPADHRRRARVGQIQADGPPVPGDVGSGSPGQVTGRLQAAQQRRHGTRREPKHPGQLARPDPGVLGHARQQLQLGHRKPEARVGRTRCPAHGPAQAGHDVSQLGADLLLPEAFPGAVSLSDLHLTDPPPWRAWLAPRPCAAGQRGRDGRAHTTARTMNAGRACVDPAYLWSAP